MESKVIFVSNREYYEEEGKLFTRGSSGGETGELFRSIFPTMKIVGRASKAKSGSHQVDCNDFLLLKLRSGSYLLKDSFAAVVQFSRASRDFDKVIVRAGGLGTLLGFVALIQNKKVGVEVGGCVFNSLWAVGSIKGKMLAPISYLIRITLFALCDRVQFVTQNYLQKRYFCDQMRVHSVGISNVEITSTLEPRKKSACLNAKKKRITVGSVGSLAGSLKGFDIALKFLQMCIAKGYNVELRLLGSGDAGNFNDLIVRKGLEEKVDLITNLHERDAVFTWMDNIDVYVQFSRREGLSRAVIEAMSRGLPVIASDVGGTDEIVNKELLVPVGSVEEYVQRFELLFCGEEAIYEFFSQHSVMIAKQFTNRLLEQKRKNFWGDF